jgi:hypothetical protein
MGTNYYLAQPATRKANENDVKAIQELLTSGRQNEISQYFQSEGLVPKEIHIGKSSYGWKFSFSADRHPNFKSWKKELESTTYKIQDEYGETITLKELLLIIESKQKGEYLKEFQWEYLDEDGYRMIKGDYC